MSTPEKSKDDVYHDRNLLAIGLLRALRNEQDANVSYEMGWWPDPNADEDDDGEWAVVWCELPTGQVSWHVPTDIVPDWLEERDPQYDGYDIETKNDRLRRWIE